MRSCWKTQHLPPFYYHLAFEANWKGEKFNKWVPHELTTDLKKKKSFWSVFSYSTQQLWTISQSDCDVWQKSGFYMTTGNDLTVWLRRNLKVFPKAKLAPKKKRKKAWSLFGGLLSDPPQLSESQWNHHSEKYAQWIKEVYQNLQHPQPVLVSRMVPVFLHNNAQLHITQATLQKLNRLRLWSFASSAISTWPLTNWLPLLQAFQQLFAGKLPQQAGCRKCFPRVCWIVKHGFLGYRNNQTYFSLAKTCWL